MKSFSLNFVQIGIYLYILQIFVATSLGLIKKDWDYKFISSVLDNKYPESVSIFADLNRISRGVLGFSGNVTFLKGNYGNNALVSMEIYRSARNDGDFQKLPYEMQNEKFMKFMNTQYKDILYTSLKDCSNMPKVEGTYDKDFVEGDVLTFKDCVFKDTETTPKHLQPGFYKIIGKTVRGSDIDVTFTVLVEVMAARN